MNYYSDVFTPETWREFSADGYRVTAFSAPMAKRAAPVSAGDRFLCYMKGRFAFIGALEATSQPYRSDQPIWGTDGFPVRVNVEPLVILPDTNPLHVSELEGKVSFFTDGQYLGSVPSMFQGSPRPMSAADGEVVLRALLAREDGVTKAAVLTPEPQEALAVAEVTQGRRVHVEIQALLVDLGLRMGCRVWCPRNDRGPMKRQVPALDLGTLLAELPMVFAGHAQATVQNIDVLWLKSNTVVAAFEVENTTAIYSGLLRMSDLMAEIPNVSFPMYVVAPTERREAVRQEITRPTFQQLRRPLSAVAGYIPYERLRELASHLAGPTARYTQPEIVESIAEKFDA